MDRGDAGWPREDSRHISWHPDLDVSGADPELSGKLHFLRVGCAGCCLQSSCSHEDFLCGPDAHEVSQEDAPRRAGAVDLDGVQSL